VWSSRHHSLYPKNQGEAPHFADRRAKPVSAECHACISKLAFQLPNPQGPKGAPCGSCKICFSFACGVHGHRDPNAPEFICVECDPTLVVASAALPKAGKSPSPTQLQLISLYPPFILVPGSVDRARIRSVDDFLARRPGYDPSAIRKQMERSRLDVHVAMENPRTQSFLQELPQENHELLLLASVLLSVTRAEPSRVPRDVLELSKAIRMADG
jgi:hypothetical protein